MDSATKRPFGPLHEDVLLATAQSMAMIRFLELSLTSEGRLRAFANAYRNNDRALLNRTTLDSYIRELERASRLKEVPGPTLSPEGPSNDASTGQAPSHMQQAYRSGEMRYVSSNNADDRLWSAFAGLKFNLISIDARTAPSPDAALKLIDPVMRNGLLDSDGFTVLFDGLGPAPRETLVTLATLLGERFKLRDENIYVKDETAVVRLG